MKCVVIGSKNPAKVLAIKGAFKRVFPETKFVFKPLSVQSEVSRQPLSEKETIKGAMNRIKNCKKQDPNADYWVGIEGGVQPVGKDLLLVEWVCVLNSKGELGKGRGLSFLVPDKMKEDINRGLSIGQSNDKFFKRNNTGDSIGVVGTLTKEIVTRRKFLKDACMVALIRFTNKRLY